MKTALRITAQAILVLTAALAFNATAQQSYPTKPIRILAGVPPGGGIDAITRIVVKQVSETNKAYIFVIENLPGANGALAINRAANAAPDGYTLVGSSDSTIVSQVFNRYEQDIRKTLAPVVLMTVQPTMLFVTASLPVNSVRELIAYARQNPGKVSFGSTGIGSNYHLGLLRFQEMAGVSMVHVPYKGGQQTAVDLASGNLKVMFGATSPLPLVRAGKAKLIAVATLERHPMFPDTPTLDESGLPGFDMTGQYRLLAPIQTPEAIKSTLNRVLGAASQAPEVLKASAPSGYLAPPILNTAELMKSVLAEHDRLEAIVRKANIKLEE